MDIDLDLLAANATSRLLRGLAMRTQLPSLNDAEDAEAYSEEMHAHAAAFIRDADLIGCVLRRRAHDFTTRAAATEALAIFNAAFLDLATLGNKEREPLELSEERGQSWSADGSYLALLRNRRTIVVSLTEKAGGQLNAAVRAATA